MLLMITPLGVVYDGTHRSVQAVSEYLLSLSEGGGVSRENEGSSLAGMEPRAPEERLSMV